MALNGVQLNPKQQDELKEAFIIYDNDGDGKVDREQCGMVMRSVGIAPTIEQCTKMLGDKVGFSLQDVQHIVATKAPPFETEDSLKNCISLFDKYGGGFIDVREFRHVLTSLGEKLKDDEVDEITREVDINGDNQINCDEFVRTIRSVH